MKLQSAFGKSLMKDSMNAPSYRSLASLQQGSTLQLLPYYPVVGEEAENMRYAIIAQKPAPIPSIDIPLRFR